MITQRHRCVARMSPLLIVASRRRLADPHVEAQPATPVEAFVTHGTFDRWLLKSVFSWLAPAVAPSE